MTTTEMIERFRLVQDKFESPYFTDSEILNFLNAAQEEVFFENDKAYSRSGSNRKAQDPSQVGVTILRNLFNIYISNSPAFTWQEMETTIGRRVYRIDNVTDNGVPVIVPNVGDSEFVNRNEFFGNDEDPILISHDGNTWTFKPEGTSSKRISVITYPSNMNLTTQNSELGEIVHNDIIEEALNLAGIASRDQVIAQMDELGFVNN